MDAKLETSSRMLEFVFRMFAEGDTAVPALGMQAIPEQLAAGLAPGTVRLNARVAAVETARCGWWAARGLKVDRSWLRRRERALRSCYRRLRRRRGGR